MTIAVIDDYVPDQHSIARYVERFLQEHGAPPPHFFYYTSGETFIGELSPYFFDLVILDCCMDGMDGLQTAQELRRREKDTALIFITSSPDYAIDGYLVGACGYLLKPYTYDAFSLVFERVFERRSDRKEMLLIPEGRIKQWIASKDIVYCDIDGHYSQIHLCTGRVMRIRMAFSELSVHVASYPQFLECYRGCIINMEHVQRAEEMNFLMDTGDRIPYRKKVRNKIIQQYSNYLFEKVRSENI